MEAGRTTRIVVDRPLTLLGPNQDKAGYADDRLPEAVIRNQNAAGTAIHIMSKDVSISGFCIEGGDRGLNGIYFNQVFSEPTDVNITIRNNRIEKFGEHQDGWGRAVHFHNNAGTDPCTYGIRIQNNFVEYAEGGIVAKYNTYANISSNKVANCFDGILYEWCQEPLPEALQVYATVHDNQVVIGDEFGWNENTGFAATYPAGKDAWGCCGIRFNIIGRAARVVARGNTVSAANTADNVHAGFAVASLDDGYAVLIDNVVNHVRDGIRVWGAHASDNAGSCNPCQSQSLQILGGSVNGGKYGLHITDWHPRPGYDEALRDPDMVGRQNRVFLDGDIQFNGQSDCKIRIFNDPIDVHAVTLKLGVNLDTNVDFGSVTDVSIVNADLPSPATVSIQKLITRNGECFYATLQAAVDDAADGDTVLVYPGTHPQSVFVERKVHLSGVVVEEGVPRPPILGTVSVVGVSASAESPLRIENLGFTVAGDDCFETGGCVRRSARQELCV